METVTVTLVGGPPDWAGKTLTYPAGTDLEAAAAVISAYQPPRRPWEDPAPRAIYDPDPDGPVTTWYFRGWFPAGVDDEPSAEG